MPSFASESSIHGIKFIFTSSHSKLSRFFWFLAFICSFSGFCYYIYGAVIKLKINPDVVLKITQRPMRELPFPAVTICTPVFCKREFFDFRFDENSSFPWIEKELSENDCKNLIANMHFCLNPGLDLIRSRCKNFDTPVPEIFKILSESSLTSEELINNQASTSQLSNSPLLKYDKIITNQGFCFTSNLQHHKVIFNDLISSDFDFFKRKIAEESGESQWTMERGYFNGGEIKKKYF